MGAENLGPWACQRSVPTLGYITGSCYLETWWVSVCWSGWTWAWYFPALSWNYRLFSPYSTVMVISSRSPLGFWAADELSTCLSSEVTLKYLSILELSMASIQSSPNPQCGFCVSFDWKQAWFGDLLCETHGHGSSQELAPGYLLMHHELLELNLLGCSFLSVERTSPLGRTAFPAWIPRTELPLGEEVSGRDKVVCTNSKASCAVHFCGP